MYYPKTKKFLLVLVSTFCLSVLTNTDEPPENNREIMGRGVLSLPDLLQIFHRQKGQIKVFVHPKGQQRVEIIHGNVTSLTGLINPGHPIKVFVHGFMSRSGAEFPTNLLDAFRHVKQGNCNLMTVDWSCSHGSHTCDLPTDYYETVGRIDFIGHRVGHILAWMHNVLALNGSSTEFYAHSLGCHISGLDPAGPGFQGDSPVAQPLTESDASNVAVIVTDGMFYGMAVPNCTTVYLNGGGIRLQPMCKDLKSDIFRTCGHSASHVYYTHSVYRFDGPFGNVSLPICADTPTETANIFLGERVAYLKRGKYFVDYKGSSKDQSSSEARLMDYFTEDPQVYSAQGLSAATIDKINCVPYFGHKFFF